MKMLKKSDVNRNVKEKQVLEEWEINNEKSCFGRVRGPEKGA